MNNAREPTIDDIKERITKLNDKMLSYDKSTNYAIETSSTKYAKNKIIDDKLLREAKNIKILIDNLGPKMQQFNSFSNANYGALNQRINELNDTFINLNINLKIPDLFDGNFETSQIESTSNFNKYILYFIFAIFIIGCLIYITKNPEAGNIDMFILALAILILAYYLYEYITTKKKNW